MLLLFERSLSTCERIYNSAQPIIQLIINDDLLSSNFVHVSHSLAATPPRKGLWLVHFCVDITVIGFNIPSHNYTVTVYTWSATYKN